MPTPRATCEAEPVTDRADHVFHRAPERPIAVRASGSTITTADGRRVLDGAGGAIASSIGHGRAEVVAAMAAQAADLEYVHSTQFVTEPLQRFAAHVAEVVPLRDARVFPVSGGSEANESAIKLARAYHLARGADRHVILARSGAYHGNSRGALDASHRSSVTSGYEPWLGQTVRVPLVNPYRDDRTGAEHASEIDRVIRATGPERIAAFIAEPVSGATLAAVVPPDDYWPEVAAVLREHGVLLIADEVMTGFGRTGRWFGMHHWDVEPDILTSGKGASSGYWPLGLCVASGEVYDTVEAADTFSHGFTWSHHPVGCAVADAVLTVIHEEGLVERSAKLGQRCRERLRDRLGDHPHTGEVRGIGLLNAVEFVADRATKQPYDRSAGVTERITAAAFELGLTVYPCTSAVDGNVGDAVMLGPALSVSEDDLDEMVDRLAAAVFATLPV
jgi:adenosylmethionine-8-amino-7-oxononanoate aminotransferase